MADEGLARVLVQCWNSQTHKYQLYWAIGVWSVVLGMCAGNEGSEGICCTQRLHFFHFMEDPVYVLSKRVNFIWCEHYVKAEFLGRLCDSALEKTNNPPHHQEKNPNPNQNTYSFEKSRSIINYFKHLLTFLAHLSHWILEVILCALSIRSHNQLLHSNAKDSEHCPGR